MKIRILRLQPIAERAFVQCLDGGCTFSGGSHAKVEDGKLTLLGLYYGEAEDAFLRGRVTGSSKEAKELGVFLAKALEADYEKIEDKKPGCLGERSYEWAGDSKKGKVWLVGCRSWRSGTVYFKRPGGSGKGRDCGV